MLKQISFTAATLLLSTTIAFADGCVVHGTRSGNTFNGATTCTDTTLSDITVNGSLNAVDTTIHANANINGRLTAKDFTVHNILTVQGAVSAQNMTVAGTTNVDGSVAFNDVTVHDANVKGKVGAYDSTINGDLTYTASNAVLSDVDVQNINVKANDTPQVLCLTNKTDVSGGVTFEAKDGTIYVSGGAKIEGAVQGAQVVPGPCQPQ